MRVLTTNDYYHTDRWDRAALTDRWAGTGTGARFFYSGLRTTLFIGAWGVLV